MTRRFGDRPASTNWLALVRERFLSIFTSGASGSNGTQGVHVLFGSIFGLSASDARVAAAVSIAAALALLAIARPDIQSALRIGSSYGEFAGASVSSVKAVDKGSCHLRIEFKIEVAHGGCSVRSGRRSARTSIRSDRRCLDAHWWAWQLVIEECLMCYLQPVP